MTMATAEKETCAARPETAPSNSTEAGTITIEATATTTSRPTP